MILPNTIELRILDFFTIYLNFLENYASISWKIATFAKVLMFTYSLLKNK